MCGSDMVISLNCFNLSCVIFIELIFFSMLSTIMRAVNEYVHMPALARVRGVMTEDVHTHRVILT